MILRKWCFMYTVFFIVVFQAKHFSSVAFSSFVASPIGLKFTLLVNFMKIVTLLRVASIQVKNIGLWRVPLPRSDSKKFLSRIFSRPYTLGRQPFFFCWNVWGPKRNLKACGSKLFWEFFQIFWKRFRGRSRRFFVRQPLKKGKLWFCL